MKDTKNSKKSMGYPALEAFVEQPSLDLEPMKLRRDKLIELSKKAKPAQEKSAAKLASIAYEYFFSLIDELLKVKNQLTENLVKKSTKKR